MKQFLSAPPILSRPVTGKDLYLYILATNQAIASVLAREDGRDQYPIYYVSKALLGAEQRYPTIEKLALEVVHIAEKLSHYFQAHPVKVRTDVPLRRALHRQETSGRLVLWSIRLSAYDVQFEPRKAIKAQALVDFIAEFTKDMAPPEDMCDKEEWSIFVDGASGEERAGTRIVVLGPLNFRADLQAHIGFKATNNIAEYEAMLAGLQLVKLLKMEKVAIHSDSQLIVNQDTVTFETKEPELLKYQKTCSKLLGEVRRAGAEVELKQVPRSDNQRADELAKAAALSNFLPNVRAVTIECPSY